MTAPPAALPPGTRIDDYEIRQWLGGGGFGLTYLARDCQLNLLVALKEFFPADCAIRTARGTVVPRADQAAAGAGEVFVAGLERFEAEARALANFRHPHIVRVLRHLRARGTAYIVMEYEQGQPLSRWLPPQRPLAEPRLMALLTPLLAGLDAVHLAGFLHRDIKPDNIYIRADGSPVLLDFGAARRLTPGGNLTNLISPGFAPLEQYHSQGEQGPWTDLYALGGVLYWIVTGRRPIEAAGRIEQDPQPLAIDAAPPGLYSASLLQAIDWALQPQARWRPRTVDAMRSALQGEAAPSNVPSLPPPSRSAPSEPQASVPQPVNRAPANRAPSHPTLSFQTAASSITDRPHALLSVGLVPDPLGHPLQTGPARQQVHELMDRVLEGIPRASWQRAPRAREIVLVLHVDPGQALDCASLLRDLAARRYRQALPWRVGLHWWNRPGSDLHSPAHRPGTEFGRGDAGFRRPADAAAAADEALDLALRLMGLAQAHEVLASGPFLEALRHHDPDRAAQFRHLGSRSDPQGPLAGLHGLVQAPYLPGASAPQEAARLAPDVVADLEAVWVRFMGPMARLLVQREARRVADPSALLEALARHLPPGQQAAFRALAWQALRRAGA
jgi:serine/threonine protein kinase